MPTSPHNKSVGSVWAAGLTPAIRGAEKGQSPEAELLGAMGLWARPVPPSGGWEREGLLVCEAAVMATLGHGCPLGQS